MADAFQNLMAELCQRFASLQLAYPAIRFTMLGGSAVADPDLACWVAEGIAGGAEIEADVQMWESKNPVVTVLFGPGATDGAAELAALADDTIRALHFLGGGEEGVLVADQLLESAGTGPRPGHFLAWYLLDFSRRAQVKLVKEESYRRYVLAEAYDDRVQIIEDERGRPFASFPNGLGRFRAGARDKVWDRVVDAVRADQLVVTGLDTPIFRAGDMLLRGMLRTDASDTTNPPDPAGSATPVSPPLTIDVANAVAHFKGQKHTLSPKQACLLQRLLDAKGGWVSGTELKEFPDSSERPDRWIGGLPEPIKHLIEGKTGAGYRLVIPVE